MGYRLFNPQLQKEIRDSFYYIEKSPYAGERIFLDSVSGALRLKKMVEAVSRESASYAQVNRVDPASDHFDQVVAKFKEDVRDLIGAEDGEIMTAMSGTHTVYRLVNAVLKAHENNGNLVTSNLEHPAVYEATWYFSKEYNIEKRVAPFDPQSGQVKAETILDKVDENTCLLALIHASNVTGAVNNIEYIIKEARKINPEIYIIIDGVQYSPHGLIDISTINPDAYVLSGYKLFAKKYTGIAYMSDRMAHLEHWRFREKPMNVWSLGAEDEATYAGFSAVVDYLDWLGSKFNQSDNRRDRIATAMDRIHEHTKGLLNLALYGDDGIKGLKEIEHVTLHGIEDNIEGRTGLIAFRIKGQDSTEMAEKYFKEGGISLSTRQRNIYARHVLEQLNVEDLIRLSICHYNIPEEIKSFLKFTENLI